MAKKFKSWDTYVKEAQRPPWVMPYGDNQKIVVSNPTGGAIMDVANLMQSESADVEQMLRLVAGDAADELLALLRTGPAQVMNEVMQDIMEHFGYAMPAGDDEGETRSRT